MPSGLGICSSQPLITAPIVSRPSITPTTSTTRSCSDTFNTRMSPKASPTTVLAGSRIRYSSPVSSTQETSHREPASVQSAAELELGGVPAPLVGCVELFDVHVLPFWGLPSALLS